MNEMQQWDDNIVALDNLRQQFEQERDAVMAVKRIHCAKCLDGNVIHDIQLLDIQQYHEPHGCTAGDYWSHQEYAFHCLSCKFYNRLLFNDYDIPYKYRDKAFYALEKIFMRFYLSLFKSVTSVKERGVAPFGPFVTIDIEDDWVAKYVPKRALEARTKLKKAVALQKELNI